jgi:hypothetical protein
MKNRYPWNMLPPPSARPEPTDAEFARAMDRAAMRNSARHHRGLEKSQQFERNHQLRIRLEQTVAIEPVEIAVAGIEEKI